MNRKFVLLLICCFCVFVANKAFAEAAINDVNAKEVLAVHNKLLKVLNSDISKEEKCYAFYDHVHSNTQELFVIVGRLMHLVSRYNDLIVQYRGIKYLEDVADELWPKLEAVANNQLSKLEYFLYFCLQAKDNSNNTGFLNKNLDYVSTVFSDKNRVILQTRLNEVFVYLTWVKEDRQWKLFNASRNPPGSGGELTAKDKQLVEEVVTNTLLIEKFNTQCYRVKKIFLDQDDVKAFLTYKFGDGADILYRKTVETANSETDTHVQETIKIFNHFGDCDKAEMKQATFVVTLKLTEGIIDTVKKAVFTRSN